MDQILQNYPPRKARKQRPTSPWIVWTIMSCAAFAVPVHAGDRLGEGGDQDRALKARSRGDAPALDSVIGQARTKGRVLDVELSGGKYKAKVLDDEGRVRNVDVDSHGGSGSALHGSGSSGGRGSGDEGSGGRGRGRGR
jgi:uncharacterized membrane protein YgcG